MRRLRRKGRINRNLYHIFEIKGDIMTKPIKIVHITMTAIAWGICICSLVRLLCVYGQLAEEIGVHFAPDGEFDVIASKKFIAYPYVISLISLTLCEILALLSQKVNIGLKVSKMGEKKLREGTAIFLDISKLGFSFFFAGVWADCVIRQHSLNTVIPKTITAALFISFILLIIFSIIVRIRYSDRVTDNAEN